LTRGHGEVGELPRSRLISLGFAQRLLGLGLFRVTFFLLEVLFLVRRRLNRNVCSRANQRRPSLRRRGVGLILIAFV
jgi:hypothetical protein